MKAMLRSALVAALLLGASASARGQFVPLSRCGAAYPCAIPFGVSYRPDPLIAGQYGAPGHTLLSVRTTLAPGSLPRVDDRRAAQQRAVSAVKSLGQKPPAKEQEPPAKEKTSKPNEPAEDKSK